MAVRLRPARILHHALNPRRVLDRQGLGNRAAGRMADETGPLNLQRVHESERVGCQHVHRIRALEAGALPGAAMVVRDDREGTGKRLDLRLPVRADAAEARHQHDGRSFPVTLIGDLNVAHLCSLHDPALFRAPAPSCAPSVLNVDDIDDPAEPEREGRQRRLFPDLVGLVGRVAGYEDPIVPHMRISCRAFDAVMRADAA